ncbi:succinate dehydrogenase, cytochrome b556 subunit [Simiduia aestuariiviva]|uniref:Succinate dehydrogenase cytochrome b556 subunit n=1 Tax=Simiduia aestuariiviva TaxID=1510459 RepID=A0A839US30_9GAMM|nr:succinate dehydrogenase / fumarate reductase cytochrome b subunit [Simiduia aestuariiviva]
MNKNRPVNLDISTIQLPITAYVSILHRVSGVALFAGVAVLLWMLEASLSSEASFEELKELTASPLCKLILWATLAGLAYHMIAGIRHLIMDMGIGESLEGGQTGAKIALALAVITITALGVWIW